MSSHEALTTSATSLATAPSSDDPSTAARFNSNDFDDSSMRVPLPSPSRVQTLASNLSSITSRISSVTSTHKIAKFIRLVAVSKLKPASDILALHQPPSDTVEKIEPHIHFGENYVQELLEKSRLLPSSINWHFIGGLQSNKCTQLARDVESLWAVESVDTLKKARALDKGRGERNAKIADGKDSEKRDGKSEDGRQLRVFVQINTSGEDSKSGLDPKSNDLVDLCRTIRDECQNLHLQGLMTIGAIARSQATTLENENEDFVCLRETRDWVAEQLSMEQGELELSMGMSEDFEGAITMGSDEVRVGSTIFGERPPKKEAVVMENVEEVKK